MGQQRTGSNPPPSEPMQYRAIGLVRGRYSATTNFNSRYVGGNRWDRNQRRPTGSDHEFGQESPDLEQEHLWVVYPRGQQDGTFRLLGFGSQKS